MLALHTVSVNLTAAFFFCPDGQEQAHTQSVDALPLSLCLLQFLSPVCFGFSALCLLPHTPHTLGVLCILSASASESSPLMCRHTTNFHMLIFCSTTLWIHYWINFFGFITGVRLSAHKTMLSATKPEFTSFQLG